MAQILYKCSLQSWIDEYLSFHASAELIQSCLANLQAKSLYNKSRGWKGLPKSRDISQFPPKQFREGLVGICDAIAEHVGSNAQTCRLTDTKFGSLRLGCAGRSCKSGGLFVLQNENDPAMATAVCNVELQPQCSTAEDMNKVYIRARDLLNEDPCRMYTYSITIDGEHITLWYWSRSHSIRSESFSFIQEPEMLVKVLIAFLCADEEALGMDPNVVRRREANGHGRICYVYAVDGRFFKTRDAVDPVSQERITGRGRRIWKVVEVRGFDDLSPVSGKMFVLKEVWLDESVLSEKEIQTKIFEGLAALSAQLKNNDMSGLPSVFTPDVSYVDALRDHLRDYKRHFLTILANYDGPVSRGLAQDATVAISPSVEHAHTFIKASMSDVERDSRKRRMHRMVYGEFCETLYQVRDLRKAIAIVQDVLKTLCLLFLAGWVHRDISPGNILYFGDEKRVILSDFEYAKGRGANVSGASDEKTGTPYFMAAEIQNGVLFWSLAKEARSLPNPLEVQCSDAPTYDANAVEESPPPIIYNYVHDVESLFWIVLWMVTMHVDPSSSGDYSPSPSIQQLFRNTTRPSLRRAQVLSQKSYLARILSDQGGLPPSLQKLVGPMDFCRTQLYYAYIGIDPITGPDALKDFVAGAHITAAHWLGALLECLPTGTLPSLQTLATKSSSAPEEPPASPPSSRPSKKRKSSTDDGSEFSEPVAGSGGRGNSGNGRKRSRTGAVNRLQNAKPRRNPRRKATK